MDGVKVALDKRGMTVEARCQCVKNWKEFVFVFGLFLGSFLNSCGCSTAKSKTPPQETIFFTHLPVQSMDPNHA